MSPRLHDKLGTEPIVVFNSDGHPYPMDTWRNNNIIMMSKQHRFDIIMTLLLHHAPIGYSAV